MTLWFHPLCAAYKRPESLLQAIDEGTASLPLPEREILERTGRASGNHRRRPRIDGAERAPSSQAKCRHCREPIERGAWRIRLVFFEEGMFTAGGFIHLQCRQTYFESDDLIDQLLHFSVKLNEDEREDLRRACSA